MIVWTCRESNPKHTHAKGAVYRLPTGPYFNFNMLKLGMVKKIGESTAFQQILDKLDQRKKYVKKEFQAYGLELAEELNDWKNKSLYIKLAKETPRQLLEDAVNFVKDQPKGQVKSRARLFMWKLKQLKKENKK